MARDSRLYLRRTLVTALKADAGVRALVAARVFGPRPPPDNTKWPYARLGAMTAVPARQACQDGNTIDVMLHAFAEGEDETDCETLAQAMAAALDGRVLDLTLVTGGAPYPAKATLVWDSSSTLSDPANKKGWHGIVRLTATVVS